MRTSSVVEELQVKFQVDPKPKPKPHRMSAPYRNVEGAHVLRFSSHLCQDPRPWRIAPEALKIAVGFRVEGSG